MTHLITCPGNIFDQRATLSLLCIAWIKQFLYALNNYQFPEWKLMMMGNFVCMCWTAMTSFLRYNHNYLIVLFHKSQYALRYLDPMCKIQNTSSQCSLATWLTVTANEQNDDWPAPVSLVSVQPVIGWLKDGVARHWSHIVHRPRPHGNLPLPCKVRNGVWYYVKYSSLKSIYVLQSHPASIPNIKTKFVVVLLGSGGNKSKNVFDILLVSVRCSSFQKSARPGARVDFLYVQKSIKTV